MVLKPNKEPISKWAQRDSAEKTSKFGLNNEITKGARVLVLLDAPK
jgi:hypothetical protein